MANLISSTGISLQRKRNNSYTPLLSSIRSTTQGKPWETENSTTSNNFARQSVNLSQGDRLQNAGLNNQAGMNIVRQEEQNAAIQRANEQAAKQAEANAKALADARSRAQAQTQTPVIQQTANTSDDGWKKYYDEEKQKVRNQAFKNNWGESTLQDIFNAGWDSRLAEGRARNRYASELLRGASDDDGNVVNGDNLIKAQETAKNNANVIGQYAAQERATGRAIGATADSDYKNNPFYGTLNAVRRMNVGNAMLGGAEGGATDAAKFVLNLLPGMATAPIQGAGNIAEALSGQGTDSGTGGHRNLTGLERMGRGVSGAIDAAGVFFGGTGDFLNEVGNALFKKGVSEAAKQAVKQTTKEVIKGHIKAMLEEGAEEGVQQAFEFFGDGGRLVTSDGEFDADSFKQLLAESGQAAVLGAVGGGLFHAGGQAVGAIKSNINNRLIAKNNTNLNANINENTNLVEQADGNLNENADVDLSRVQTNQDGSMVKTNTNGTTTRLSDAELANVATQNYTPQTLVTQGLTPFQDNSVKVGNTGKSLNSLVQQAEQGNTYAYKQLAKLVDQNQNEKTDWRGKSVDEVINPERAKTQTDPLTGERYTDMGIDGEAFDTDVRFETTEERNKRYDKAIERYYEKYGDDFYEKMPEPLQDRYEELLSLQPRDRNDNYIDPITGGRTVDLVVEGGAPDGSNLIKTEYNLPDDASVAEIGQAIKKVISERFQGNVYKVGDTGTEATINRRSKNELSHKQNNMSNADFTRKGSMIGNLDELIENMNDVRRVKNHKTSAKPDVDYYLSGRVAVDLGDGKIYYPRVDIEVGNNGNAIGYDIADIKEFPRAKSQTTSFPGGQTQVDDTGTHSHNSIISQSGENVNRGVAAIGQEAYDNLRTRLAEQKAADNLKVEIADNTEAQAKRYYKKYGDDFYEKMPDSLKERYEAFLDKQPRDENGVYIDPITGGKTIDSEANRTDNSASQNATRVYKNESDTLPADFDVAHYISDQVEAQKKRSKLPLRERISDVTAELKHYLVDDAVAYERYIKDKNERLNIREGVDRVRSSDLIASQYMKDHGLLEIGKLSDADMNEFQQYMIAKRALEVANQGKTTGRSRAADQALIDYVGDKYAKEEAIVRQYTRDMLEYSAENGLISKKLKNDLIENNPNYVPLNRVLDNIEERTGFRSKQLGNLGKQSVVQRMTGSERVIENPIESLMNNTMRMINEVERNKTAKLITQSEAFHEKMLMSDEKPRPGYDKLSYMVDGETISYEVPKLVAKEMKNLNSVLPDAVEKAFRAAGIPTKWLRAGATQNNPIFAISNLVRDQMQTIVTGNISANLRGSKDAIVATFSPGEKGQALRAELNRAGIIGSEYRQTYGYKPNGLVEQLQVDAQTSKSIKNKLKHPIDTLADVIGKTEYFTRAQQYFGTNGDATAKAQAARNNTLNFSRAGATVRVLNRVIPFLNAGVQGGRATVNSFKNRPVHTTLAVASLAGVALAAKAASQAQNQELWDRIDDSDKGQNIIILTPNAHYDSETNRVEGVIKIPVAQMLYPIMDAVNNMNGTPEDAEVLAGDIFTAVTGLESPNSEDGFLPMVNQLTPTVAKPFVEWSINKSTYTGNDLVSEYDSNKAPEDKGAKYTTGLARSIASVTGIDAPVIDNFIQNWGGGLAKDLSKVLTDNPDNKGDGGGIGTMFENGFNRRFLSGTVESQYEIADGLANNYKNEVKGTEIFNGLTNAEQQTILDAIDDDMKSIASMAAKVERGQDEEISSNLSRRQTEIVRNGFDADSYMASVLDKNTSYTADGGTSDIKTLNGDIMQYGNTSKRNNAIDISDNLAGESRDILELYNSMSSDDWNKYLYGATVDSVAAEYNLAKAKYENDLANNELTAVQKITKQRELAKLEVSQRWTKNYRDAYSLAGSKVDMQTYLDGLDEATRAQTVGILNGLNNTMYNAGIITASTYKSRANAINNTASSTGSSNGGSKYGGITSAEASAISSLAKAKAINTGAKAKTPSVPTTKRKLGSTRAGNSKTGLKTYSSGLAKNVSVSQGAKRNIA